MHYFELPTIYCMYIQMEEIWKDIEEYEGLYQVSNQGRVKSLKYGKERILKPAPNSDGYLFVVLCKDGKTKTYFVHRLVAMAFIPNPEGLPCINHKSCIRTENNVNNIEWCDHSYNNSYGARVEKYSKPVIQMSLNNEVLTIWPSASEASKKSGFNTSAICRCCQGKLQTHKGFKWEYLN